jgi:hypothetical protein
MKVLESLFSWNERKKENPGVSVLTGMIKRSF